MSNLQMRQWLFYKSLQEKYTSWAQWKFVRIMKTMGRINYKLVCTFPVMCCFGVITERTRYQLKIDSWITIGIQ